MEGISGKYVVKNRWVRSSKQSYDEVQQAALWEVSVNLTGVGFKGAV